MTRLLFECTYVFEHPDDNSGIQRVVRNMIRQLAHIQSPVECIPVIMKGDQLHRVISLAPLTARPLIPQLEQLIVWFDRIYRRSRKRYEDWDSGMERLWPSGVSHRIRRVFFALCKLASLGITLPLKGLIALNRRVHVLERTSPLQARAGDQLVLLDSSWHADFFPLAQRLKGEGIGIISVIYDLIPLTHPRFCDEPLVKVFEKWFDWIASTADGYIAISNTISLEVRSEIERRVGPVAAARRWHDHFQLGSDLDLAPTDVGADALVSDIFAAGEPIYLMVSTIEPRKNHAYLLDAFEILWRRGLAVRLCIIGKIGWKCELLVERIRTHPQLNKRLFMLNNVNDSGLEFAYRKSRALLFPSFVEGFGLPLVEAMQRDLPAIGSDIPVFREVGKDFMLYFDLDDPNSLALQIVAFEKDGTFPAARRLADWRWPRWREATQQFVDRVLAGTELFSEINRKSALRVDTANSALLP